MKQTILFLLTLFVLTIGKAQTNNKIRYQVSPVVKENVQMLKVIMSFNPDKSGNTFLEYADNPWGEERMQECVVAMKTIDFESNIAKDKENNWIRIEHAKTENTLNFEYIIQQDFEGNIDTQNYFRPVINANYFHVISQSFFMIPKHLGVDADEKLTIEIVWEGFEKNFVIHNSFGSQERHQVLKDISKGNFQEAVFVGGDFRLYNREIKGNKIVLATRGKWNNFEDTTVVKLLHTTVRNQRDFWKDHSQKYFTVTLLPIESETNSYGYSGTGLLLHLFNHELMHNWIRVSSGMENEEQLYWLSEGFTEYYTFKNIAKNRILNKNGSYFINRMNKAISELCTSPVAESPNSDLNEENFWTNRDYEQLPYKRGALIAFILDLKIQKESNGASSLDDVVRDFFKTARQNSGVITNHLFIEVANKYAKTPVDSIIEEHIIKGKLPNLEKVFAQYNLEFNPDSDVFDLGFTPNEEYNKILDVDTTSNAYKAGLRKTDQLGRWGFTYGVIDKNIKMEVLKEGEKVIIEYLPVRKVKIPKLLDNKNNKEKLKL